MKSKPSIKIINNREILNVGSMEFEQGKIYTIMGSNGCGKSTFAKFLSLENGLYDDQTELKIGYMPQKNYAYRMSVLKNAMLTAKSIDDAKDILNKLGMNDLHESNAKNLSGGETAKLALARILLGQFNVIILDEPTSAMDTESVYLSESLIKEYAIKKNAVVILITHSVGQAKRLGDEIIFLSNGHVLEQGNVNDILENPKTDEAKRFFAM